MQLEEFLSELKAEQVDLSKAMGFRDCINKISQKIQLGDIELHMVDTTLSAAKQSFDPIIYTFLNAPAAASCAKDKIIMNDKIMDLFGAQSLNHALPDELQAVIAHECYHCNHYTEQKLGQTLPIFALPAITMLGVYLYDKAKEKSEKEYGDNPTKQQISESLNNVYNEADAHSMSLNKNETMSEPRTFKQNLLTFGKYAAAGALGLAGGVLLSKMVDRHHEFKADAFAAEIVGKDAMKNALEKLATVYKEKEILDQFHPVVQTVFKVLNSHPTFDRRIDALNCL